MRIYEFSKQIGVASKELVEALRKGGFEVSSHMSVLDDERISFLQNIYQPKRAQESARVQSKKDVQPVLAVEKPASAQKKHAVAEKPAAAEKFVKATEVA